MDTQSIIGYLIMFAVVVVGVLVAGWLKTRIET